jgi:hypothetical protein
MERYISVNQNQGFRQPPLLPRLIRGQQFQNVIFSINKIV